MFVLVSLQFASFFSEKIQFAINTPSKSAHTSRSPLTRAQLLNVELFSRHQVNCAMSTHYFMCERSFWRSALTNATITHHISSDASSHA